MGATQRASALWIVWLRCSLLTGRCGHARLSRLAIQPKALSRDVVEYFNRLLGPHAFRLADCLGETKNRQQRGMAE